MTDQETGTKWTRDELTAAFNMVADKTNWKLPIRARIERADFERCNAAAIFFAGSPLTLVRWVGPNRSMVRVTGSGYYICIGA